MAHQEQELAQEHKGQIIIPDEDCIRAEECM